MAAKKTINTDLYRTTHGCTPVRTWFGTWFFAPRGQEKNMDAWVEINLSEYGEAKKQIPAGEWIVLP